MKLPASGVATNRASYHSMWILHRFQRNATTIGRTSARVTLVLHWSWGWKETYLHTLTTHPLGDPHDKQLTHGITMLGRRDSTIGSGTCAYFLMAYSISLGNVSFICIVSLFMCVCMAMRHPILPKPVGHLWSIPSQHETISILKAVKHRLGLRSWRSQNHRWRGTLGICLANSR